MAYLQFPTSFFSMREMISVANACELCPERFNRFNELRTHMRRAHQIIHRCHLCAYSSSVKSELRKHVIRCHENGVRCTVDGCVATVAYNRFVMLSSALIISLWT